MSYYEHDNYARESYGEPEGGGYIEGKFVASSYVYEDSVEFDEIYWEDAVGECEYDTEGESYYCDVEGDEDGVYETLETLCTKYLNDMNLDPGRYLLEGEAYIALEAGGIYEVVSWGRHPDDRSSEFSGSPIFTGIEEESKIDSVKITRQGDL